MYRGNVDNSSPTVFEHGWEGIFGQVKAGAKIEVDDLLPFFIGEVLALVDVLHSYVRSMGYLRC